MELISGVLRTTWIGAPQQIPSGPKLPGGDGSPHPSATWASARGDAGWAGVLAESFATDPSKPAYLIYNPGTDVLKLFGESLSLLPPAKRWDVTFSTYFTELPLNLTCTWRAVVAGTPAATEALRLGPRALVLDLTKPAIAPPTGVYADAARTGGGPVTPSIGGLRAEASSLRTAAVGAASSDTANTNLGLSAEQAEEISIGSGAKSGRRRLLPATKSGEMEEERPDLPDFSDMDEGGKMPPQVVVRRGMPGWLFIIGSIPAFAIGVGAGLLVSNRFHELSRVTDNLGTAQTIASTTQSASPIEESLRQQLEAERQGRTADNERMNQETTFQKEEIARLTRENQDLQKPIDHKKVKEVIRPIDTSAAATVPAIAGPVSAPSQIEIKGSPLEGAAALPIQLIKGDINPPQDSSFAIDGTSLPAGGQLYLAWPSGNVTYSYDSHKDGAISLSESTSTDANGALLRVVARYVDPYAVSATHDVQVIAATIRMKESVVDFIDWNSKFASDVAPLLRQSVFVVRDKDAKPVAKFSFRQLQAAVIASPNSTFEIPQVQGSATIELVSDLDDGRWIKSLDSQRASLVYDGVADPTLKFRVWFQVTDRKQFLQWDWPDKYGDATSIADKLDKDFNEIAEYKNAAKFSGEGNKYRDADLPKLFKSMKRSASNMVRDDNIPVPKSDEEKRTLAADRANQEKEFNTAKTAIDEIRQRKRKFATDTRLNEFSVILRLPNELELQTVHIKPGQ